MIFVAFLVICKARFTGEYPDLVDPLGWFTFIILFEAAVTFERHYLLIYTQRRPIIPDGTCFPS